MLMSNVTWEGWGRISILDAGRSRPAGGAGRISAWRTMSPLVHRSRVKKPHSDDTQQHWGMLVFESLSAGVMAVLVTIMAVMAAFARTVMRL
jgi:hypothetical protein